jgi:AP-1 complex subunit mu
MRVYLSGMPELRLGLNDKILFETTGRMFVFSFQLITNFYFNI